MEDTYDINLLAKQYPVIRDFLYHYISYKELISQGKGPKGGEKFWSYTVNAHLSQAIMNWSMVFGSLNNPIHWKRLDRKESTWDTFILKLLDEINITEFEWKEYRGEIVEFRNKFLAHREILFKKPVPYLDIAYKTAHFYDQWIREFIEPDIFDLPTLIEVESDYRVEVRELIKYVYKEKG